MPEIQNDVELLQGYFDRLQLTQAPDANGRLSPQFDVGAQVRMLS
jgi:hypothetical protein